MRAIVCEALGDATLPVGSGVLRLDASHPAPPITPKSVRIKVCSASVNFPDALMVQGTYQTKPNLPFIPGAEVAGVVVEVGSGVKQLKIGDRVCAVCQTGAFSEEVVVPEFAAWVLPEGLPLEASAAVPVVYGTAELALFHRAGLQMGQALLVLGAAGGVGLAACQMGLLVGAQVVAVVQGAEKAAFLRQQGVTHVIDLASLEGPLHKVVKKLVPAGVNVVFDPVGGPMFGEALKCVGWGAQYLIIGFASGSIPKVMPNILLVKNTTLHAIFWGSYMVAKPQVLREGMNRCLRWMEEGKLKVQVSHSYPLEMVHKAFQAISKRKVMGKAILTMQQEAPRSRL